MCGGGQCGHQHRTHIHQCLLLHTSFLRAQSVSINTHAKSSVLCFLTNTQFHFLACAECVHCAADVGRGTESHCEQRQGACALNLCLCVSLLFSLSVFTHFLALTSTHTTHKHAHTHRMRLTTTSPSLRLPASLLSLPLPQIKHTLTKLRPWTC